MDSEKNDRVLIAEDVIKALETKRMITILADDLTCQDTYVDLDLEHPMSEGDPRLELDAQQFIKDRTCTVCAKGAVLVAAIDRFDKVKLKDVYDPRGLFIVIDGSASSSKRFLAQWFEPDQLTLMEAAFEASLDTSSDLEAMYERHRQEHMRLFDEERSVDEDHPEYDDYLSDRDYEESNYGAEDTPLGRAYAFGCRYDTAKQRLVAIMENIIANDGEFVP